MGIKLGNIDAKYIKVGSADCKVYLGDTLLYPQSPTPPTPTLHWVSYSEGDAIPTGKSFYGMRANVDGLPEPSDSVIVQILNDDIAKIFEIGWDGSAWYASYGNEYITDDVYDSETGYITIIFSDYNSDTYNDCWTGGEDVIPFDVDLYEEETPTPQTLQWVTFNTGDTIPSTLDIYGIKFSDAEMAMNTFGNSSQPFYIEPYRRVFDIYIGGKYYDQISTSFEVVFSEIDSSYAGDYINFNNDIVVDQNSCPIQLYIYA